MVDDPPHRAAVESSGRALEAQDGHQPGSPVQDRDGDSVKVVLALAHGFCPAAFAYLRQLAVQLFRVVMVPRVYACRGSSPACPAPSP